METKPIVTSHGNQSLFSALHNLLLQGLPREPTEWRRSYGRAPKTLLLEASFVPFDEDILPSDTDKTLVSRPYFHIFWTDCDLESYKQTVKEEMSDWYGALKNKSNPDWLIVVVINDESKTKSKLLPRASVIDKVKSDFCSKQPDRCIVLNEPFKTDQKSSESWTNFLQRLRGLMLQAFNRHLNKYEENMRSLREKRNEPGWDFINFFLVQEELAFMFEMLGLYDDALIQYDELDALFTQFVISQKAQNKTIGWLTQFSGECNSWAGLSLRKAINHEKRDQIKCHKFSLLDFRNYLFSRFSALLFLLKKPWEVGQRAISFLHNTIQEVHSLKIDMPDGALDCWVFLSCLEILQTCERYLEPSQPTIYSISQADLWDYTRRKLYGIGEKCGLMPESTPTSQQLLLVIDLTSGMGLVDDDDAGDQKLGVQRPRDKLREALSSQESFQKIYLELCELTMGTFKHIGRFRSARLIGKDLANYYMRTNEPTKAENFLLDALKSYQREGWKTLSEGTRLDLTKCLERMSSKLKFLRTCCHIISSCSLAEDVRRSHLQMFLDVVQSAGSSFLLKCSQLFSMLEVMVATPRVIAEQHVEVEVVINSHAPCDITCNKLAISLKQMPNALYIPGLQKRKVYRQVSDGSTLREPVANFNPIAKQTPSLINVQAHYEGPTNNLTSCGIVCINTHELLRRADSSGKGTKKSDTVLECDDFTNCLLCGDLVIHPGQNTLKFVEKTSKEGRYKLSQLSVQIGGANFLQWLDMDQYFWVKREEPSCIIQPVDGDYLLAGIQQALMLTVHPGSVALVPGCKLSLTLCTGLTLEEEEEGSVPELAIREEGDGPCLTVTEVNPDGSVTFELKAFHVIPESEDVDAKITLGCDVFMSPVNCDVEFVSPFIISHKLHTSVNRKFLQVVVHSNTDRRVELQDPSLSVDSKDMKTISLNKPDQQLALDTDQEVSYLWQIESNINLTRVPVSFSIDFQCDCDLESKNRNFSYHFEVESVMTQYIVKVNVLTKADDNNSCVVGTMASLKVTLQTAADPMEDMPVLFYELLKDNSQWSPGDKKSGLIDMREKQFAEVELEVMPLSPGMLSLPRVEIYRCQNDVWMLQNKQSEGADDTPDLADVKTVPFQPGQVYYASTGHHVNVRTQMVSSG